MSRPEARSTFISHDPSFVEQMSSRDYPHLNDLSQIRFLIIDEADRMIKQGSFPQLTSILDAVQKANPMDDDDDDEDDLDDDDDDDQDRLLSLPGIRGEAKVEMLSEDILAHIEEQRTGNKPIIKEVDDEDVEFGDEVDESVADDVSLPLAPPVDRLTFVYSATLTLPASEKYVKTKKRKSKYEKGVEGAIAEILDRAHAKGKTKVVDLASGNKVNSTTAKETPADGSKQKKEKEPAAATKQFRLPPGLSLQQIKCTQKHKDSHLYAYLMTTAEGAAGPCIVFCNSIAGVRRVGATLQALGMDVRILHAQMQQVRWRSAFAS